jgi:hypothetical protein
VLAVLSLRIWIENRMLIDLAKIFIDLLRSIVSDRRSVRVLVHLASFDRDGRECYFVNVTNLSRNRTIEITHVWFDTTRPVSCSPVERPLPKRLSPDESWETWADAGQVLSSPVDTTRKSTPFDLARVRLSTGKVIKSQKNRNVPPEGSIAGSADKRPHQDKKD